MDTKLKTDLLEQKAYVESYLKQSPSVLSVFSFVSIFTWQDFFDFEFKLIDENLCIFARHELGSFQYLPPLGKNISSRAVEHCFAYMRETNRNKGVTRIENANPRQLSFFPEEKYSFYKKNYEYLYFKKDLIGLKGNDYKSKRWAHNHFVKNYHCQILPFDEAMGQECLALYDVWSNSRRQISEDPVYDQMLTENRQVHELALRYYKKLGLRGLVVVVDNEIKAYTIGYEINKDVFCVFLEIADIHLNGLSTFIFHKFCQDPRLNQYRFINVMDDFELKNIQQTKMSFRPAVLYPGYVVTEKIYDHEKH